MGRRNDDADIDANAYASDAVDRRTLFVRGVAYSATNEDLEAAFAAVGPVRSAFLVGGSSNVDAGGGSVENAAATGNAATSTSTSTTKHKGVGFVQFALPEDADRAVKELDGKLLSGRRIRVEQAQKRASFEERRKNKNKTKGDGAVEEEDEIEEEEAAPKARRSSSNKPSAPREKDPSTSSTKHKLVRTVAIGNITSGTSKAALAAAKSIDNAAVEEVIYPAPESEVERARLRRDGCGGSVAFVVYDSVRSATAAVAKLHGSQVSATDDSSSAGGKKKNKKNDDGENPSSPSRLAPEQAILWARQVSGEGALAKKWRVIVRNLSFSADEKALREALSPAGFVWELSLPRKPDGRPRGFAFAAFTCRAHAERAISLVNGLEVGGRAVAVDWAVGKAEFENANANATGSKADAAAASKDDAKEEKEEKKQPKGKAGAGDEEKEEEEEEDEKEVDVAAERALLAKVASQFDKDDDKEEAKGDDKKSKKSKKEKEAEDEKAAAAAKEEKKAAAAARAAAAVDAAAKKLEQSSAVEATVFVRNIPAEATAGELRTRLEGYGDVKAARLVMDKASGRPKGTAFVEFADAAAAARAAAASKSASSGDGPPISLRGRDLDVTLALTQEGARTLAVTRADQGVGDARNLYLSREGRIEPGSEAWKALSPSDRAARERAATDARTKLRSPNFAVSRTRLCLRNLPFSIDEATLRPLLTEAVTLRAASAKPKLVQVKILSGENDGGVGGGDETKKKKQSNKGKGMAFAEFTEHEHALCALRTLNNSPAPFGADRRPIVEFAIDDARALQRRARAAEARASSAAAGEGDDKKARKRKKKKNEEGESKEGRGKRQRERKRQQQKQEQEAAAGATEDSPKSKRQKKRASNAPEAPATPMPKKRQQEQQQRKQQQQRPRAETASANGGISKMERRKGGVEKKDRLDELVSQYKSKLFGGGEEEGKAKKRAKTGGDALGEWL